MLSTFHHYFHNHLCNTINTVIGEIDMVLVTVYLWRRAERAGRAPAMLVLAARTQRHPGGYFRATAHKNQFVTEMLRSTTW